MLGLESEHVNFCTTFVSKVVMGERAPETYLAGGRFDGKQPLGGLNSLPERGLPRSHIGLGGEVEPSVWHPGWSTRLGGSIPG